METKTLAHSTAEKLVQYIREQQLAPGAKIPTEYELARMLGVGRQPAPDEGFDLRPGDGVTHKVFGGGMVISVTPMGNDHLVEVAFDGVGTKKVMAKFARLKKV